MTVNEFYGKVHLPSVVTHFSWDTPKLYRKLPAYGWYGLSKSEDMTFNCLDLFAYNSPNKGKYDDAGLITNCYRYYTYEHPELLEIPMPYSETVENRLVEDYLRRLANERFYRACRAEALEGSIIYNTRTVKFSKLLNDLGMPEFLNAGIGIITPRIVRHKSLEILKLQNKIGPDTLLIPTFFGPNYKLASLEASTLGDLTTKRMIYKNNECGWYGRLGTNIVGNLRDLLSTPGCTWTPKIADWVGDKVLTLHHSLQPNQCIEIWTNKSNLVTDKDPLSLIDKQDLEERIKDNIGKLTISQITELQKVTGVTSLATCWLNKKTSEAEVAGLRFLSSHGKYYYCRGTNVVEYTNFIMELTRIKKEDGEFYQHGYLVMNDDHRYFKIKRKYFISHDRFLKEITDFALEAGLGIPTISPNLKYYIVNVIEAFNPVNIIEKPKPTSASSTPKAANEQNDTDDEL